MRRMTRSCIASAALVLSAANGPAAELGSGWKYDVTGAYDVLSGYVLYGGRQNDEPCCWTFLNMDFGHELFGVAGASLVQNTDFTSRRGEMLRHVNEWDWGLYYRNGIDIAEGWRLQGDINHIWYKYHGIRPAYKRAYATAMEIVTRLSLENPFVVPYVFVAYDHKITRGTYTEGGFRRDFALPWNLTVTPDMTVGGANGRYLPCIYPTTPGKGGCISYAQFALKMRYKVTDWLGIHGMAAWVSIVDNDLRYAIDTSDSPYANDFVWGFIGVDFAF